MECVTKDLLYKELETLAKLVEGNWRRMDNHYKKIQNLKDDLLSLSDRISRIEIALESMVEELGGE